MGTPTEKPTSWVLDLSFLFITGPTLDTQAPAADVAQPTWIQVLAILLKTPRRNKALSLFSFPDFTGCHIWLK
jgi:hypothetical protein